MSERPILFSGPMVRAILEGRKTQTRRVVKGCPDEGLRWTPVVSNTERQDGWETLHGNSFPCPYGRPGDRLWVRETWAAEARYDDLAPRDIRRTRVFYPASGLLFRDGFGDTAGKLRPSIHMPRWASRIDLDVTGVRVERLNEISDEDVFAEGIERAGWGAKLHDGTSDMPVEPKTAYGHLWDSLNAKRAPWASNPLVWVPEFKKVMP